MMFTARLLTLIAVFALVATACGSSEDTTTTPAQAAATTTTAAAATTTTAAAATTTTEAATTTTEAAAVQVDATTVVGVLQPYSDDGGDLFPAGSVEAHWYQWGDFYVVLYRGFDAAAGQEICAGNSVLVEGVGFTAVTNSPYLGAADAICIDAAAILEPPDGVFACGSLLYYLTAIPVDETGTLFGTLEIGHGGGVWQGHTSQALSDPGVPAFEPGLAAYGLPPSDVDDLGIIACGA